MALIRPIPSSGSGVTLTGYKEEAPQNAITYTATDDQEIIISAHLNLYSGSGSITAAGTTVFTTTTTGNNYYTSPTGIHLNAGETVVVSGNAQKHVTIATTGAGTIVVAT